MSKEVKSPPKYTDHCIFSYVNSAIHIQGLSLKFFLKNNKASMIFKIPRQKNSESEKKPVMPTELKAKSLAKTEADEKENLRVDIDLIGHCAPAFSIWPMILK